MASSSTIGGISVLDGAKAPPSSKAVAEPGLAELAAYVTELWKANTEPGFRELVADPRELFFRDIPEGQG